MEVVSASLILFQVLEPIRNLWHDFITHPFQGQKFTNYVGLDVSGLNVVPGRPGVFVVPNEGPLNILGRVVEFGSSQ